MEARDVILRPIISEKSYDQIEKNKYTFEVDKRATKPQIKRAVEEIFDVGVLAVNTIKVHGKPKKQGYTRGRRPDRKKAVVTLREGDRIEIFEGK
ncbi:MAG: 50S ribosomal protein L23 [Actinobacteria bacterium]|nr:MAG: 50S ribosomal protein L23 [Actinomycetota bacterium]